MTTKRALQKRPYDFLRRQSVKKAASNAGKTPKKGYAFGDPRVRAARKSPTGR